MKTSLNKNLDYNVYEDFYDFKIAGVDFGSKIKKDHKNINIKNHKSYIDYFYKQNESLLEEEKIKINKLFQSKEKSFYKEIEKIFYIDISKNNYKCFISIFNCNPRYLKTKSFQVFYKKSESEKLAVIFHEILHFVFFKYCDKYLKEYSKNFDKNSGKLWELSEIFNVIILNTKELQKILNRKEKLFYKELKKDYKILKREWVKNRGDLKNFIKNYI